MEQLRVLVVDDHDDFRKGLEAMLAADRHRRGRRHRGGRS